MEAHPTVRLMLLKVTQRQLDEYPDLHLPLAANSGQYLATGASRSSAALGALGCGQERMDLVWASTSHLIGRSRASIAVEYKAAPLASAI